MIHHKHLHATVATARSKVDWSLLGGTQDDVITIPEGIKEMLVLGTSAHALSFACPQMETRFFDIAKVMSVDYPDDFNAHITLGRGSTFRQPSRPYDGPLVFGPEVAEPFLAGISFPRGIPINRNQYREPIGLPLHDDEAAKEAEYRSRVKVPDRKNKISRERLRR